MMHEVSKSMMRWVDNHCHLDPGEDGDGQIAAAELAGVLRFIDVGTDGQRSMQAVATAMNHPNQV